MEVPERPLRRRKLLASIAATSIAGCLDSAQDTGGSTSSTGSPEETTVPDRTPTETTRLTDDETVAPREETWTTRTQSSTPIPTNCWERGEIITPTESGEVPPLNATDYSVVWPLRPDGTVGTIFTGPISSETGGAVGRVLYSESGWDAFLEDFEKAVGSKISDQFSKETDFQTESVVVFQSRVTSTGGRLRLASVTDIGTKSPQLCIHAVVDNGTNATPTRLLVLRLPNQGVKPSRPIVSFLPRPSGDPTTIFVKPYR